MWKRTSRTVPPPPMGSIKKNWDTENGKDLSALYDQDTTSRTTSVMAPESPAALLLTRDLIGMVNYSFIKGGKK